MEKTKIAEIGRTYARNLFSLYEKILWNLSLLLNTQKKRNFTARNSGKLVMKLGGRNRQMYHPLVAMETGFISCNIVVSKEEGLRYSKLCLNPDIFTGLKGPEHQEKYISLLAKIEEMVKSHFK